MGKDFINRLISYDLYDEEDADTLNFIKEFTACKKYFKINGDALDYIEKRAKEGNAVAEYIVAKNLRKGYFSMQEKRYVLEYTQKSSDQGYLPAIHYLGVLYRIGYTVDKDINKAVRLLKIAAKKGYPRSLYDLGRAYLYGDDGIEIDVEKGLDYIRRAADLGFPLAYTQLAGLYESGEFVEKDLAKSEQLRNKIKEEIK